MAMYAMLTPTFLLLAVFSLVPFVWAIATSFFDYEVGAEAKFIGLANYAEYFTDPTLLSSFGNLAFLTAFGLATVMTAPLIIAKLIFSLRSERAKYLYRVLFLIPIVVPGVAGLMICKKRSNLFRACPCASLHRARSYRQMNLSTSRNLVPATRLPLDRRWSLE